MFLFRLIGRLIYGPQYRELERRASNDPRVKLARKK